MTTAKRRFGLKLWSKDFIKNKAFVQSAEAALKDGKFDYLELFALPDTFEETQAAVKVAFGGVLAVIHAPHAVQKLDISNPEEFESNRQRLMSSQQFADMLGAEMIILHPGLWRGEKYLEESMRQFKAFGECAPDGGKPAGILFADQARAAWHYARRNQAFYQRNGGKVLS